MKCLIEYTEKRFGLLSDLLMEFDANRNPEAIHKVRLEIKKIKALLGVTRFCNKGFRRHKAYASFRVIFKIAGKIRQADIADDISRSHGIGIRRIRNKKEFVNSKLCALFQEETTQFLSRIKDEKKKLILSVKEIRRPCFENYLRTIKEKLHHQLHPQFNHRELHRIRKRVKEILYLSQMSNQIWNDHESFYDTLQALIGQWHDKQSLLSELQRRRNSVGYKHIKTECADDLENIRHLTKAFYVA